MSQNLVQVKSKSGDIDRLLKELPARAKAVRMQLPLLAALWTLNDMKRLIPSGDAARIYKKSLDVARVLGRPGVYAIRANPKARKVKRVEVKRVILFVQKKTAQVKALKDIGILEKYGPWTYETIPFMPDPKKAKVIAKKVGRKKVEEVTKRVTKPGARAKVARLLARAGRRTKSKKEMKIPKGVQKLPNVVFDALRMEFGLGPGQSKPHWRVAVRHLIRMGLKQVLRADPRLIYALTRPSYTGWKNWPSALRKAIRLSEAQKFVPFQKRLGIRL